MSREERDIEVLIHILELCNDCTNVIVEFGKSFEIFCEKRSYQLAVEMAVYEATEYTGHLSQEFKDNHSEIQWAQIKGFRNIIAHDYFKVEIDQLWQIATMEIPALAEFCEKTLKEQK